MQDFMFLLIGLSDFHNCQFIMDHLLQARNPCPHTATIGQYHTNDNDFFSTFCIVIFAF